MLSAAVWLAMHKWKLRAGRLVAIPVLFSFQGGHISIDMLGGGSCMSWIAWLVACFFVVLPKLCHA